MPALRSDSEFGPSNSIRSSAAGNLLGELKVRPPQGTVLAGGDLRAAAFPGRVESAFLAGPFLDGEGRVKVSTILRAHYSILNAFMGEMDAARLAGIMAAKKAQMANPPAATIRAKGSQLETPYSSDEISRPAPTASGSPSKRPINTRLNAPCKTRRRTFARSAPSAMRMPISFVRCATA